MLHIRILLLMIIGNAAIAAEPRVDVNGEVLLGRTMAEYNVSAFLGVPFALPPVGDLRWQGPKQYRARSGNRDATRFAPACMQEQRIVDWYRDLAELFGNSRDVVPDLPVSEDCLYLNIWSPDLVPVSKLPVMVYIYGGSNKSGWSWEPNYHGHALAAQGVVVVSIAYRVGDFGFFAHPDLNDLPTVANFGLWDQVAALQWVQENIAAFGGDPDRVTLFGESAGAANIVSLMFSRRADKLFSQAILQSTAGFGLGETRSLSDERQRGAVLAKNLGGDRALTIAEMRELPAQEFLQRSDENMNGHYHASVIDGVLLDETVTKKLADDNYLPRRMIIGTNADEWYATISKDADIAALETQARGFFPSSYEATVDAVRDEKDVRIQIDRVHTAGSMLCPSQYVAKRIATKEYPVWMYRFSRAREGKAGEQWRAYHGVELPYAFGTHDEWMQVSDTDRYVTEATMSYWLQFAKTGNPNSNKTTYWPKLMASGVRVQNIDDPVTTIVAPEADLCEIYEKELQLQ